MALVVEDGTGLSTAESYISVTNATTYLAARRTTAQLATWTAADTAAKENALRLAAQWLDTRYKDEWASWRFSDDQALDFPRSGVVIDGVAYETTEIPQQLIDATAELGLKVTDGDVLFDDMADEGTVGSKSIRVGPISEATTYLGGSKGIKRYRL
ncbi:hypothetical protein LCGC14_3040730, partial [marine sediment metagenome]